MFEAGNRCLHWPFASDDRHQLLYRAEGTLPENSHGAALS